MKNGQQRRLLQFEVVKCESLSQDHVVMKRSRCEEPRRKFGECSMSGYDIHLADPVFRLKG